MNLLETVAVETDKKIAFPKLKQGESDQSIVRKFITYYGKIRRYSGGKQEGELTYAKSDVAQVIGDNVENCQLMTVAELDWDIQARIKRVVAKYTTIKAEQIEMNLVDKLFVLCYKRGGSSTINAYRVVVDDALFRVRSSYELTTWYTPYLEKEMFYSIVSYSFMELVMSTEPSLLLGSVGGTVATTLIAAYLKEEYEIAFASSLNKRYSNTSFKTMATIYTDKIYQDEELNSTTWFNQLGFRKVEIDTQTYQGQTFNQEKFHQLEKQWLSLTNKLPHSANEPELKFRKLGKYKAAGLYVPGLNILAVDVRSSNSFIHEYGHYLDYTYGKRELSMAPSFLELRTSYMANLNTILYKDVQSGDMDKVNRANEVNRKLEYFTTPTEVFARAFELWIYNTIDSSTELTKSKDYHIGPEYRAFDEMLEPIYHFFEMVFAGFKNHQEIYDIAETAALEVAEQTRPVYFVSHRNDEPTNVGEQLTLF